MTSEVNFPVIEPLRDPARSMICLEWFGTKDVRIGEKAVPLITEPGDAIIRVTSTTICGSDLHLYHNEFPGMQKGDVLGHEFMGIVEDVGNQVTTLAKGDRVVCSAVIACGKCSYCKEEKFSCCDNTNQSKEMEKQYGHRIAGLFGYSHLTGGYDGGQAEYVRVPLAEVNCLKVPSTLTDEQVLFLSDIACTGWHANELGDVKEGQTVAVWGCGPVGLMTLMWAKFRGAKQLIAIDSVPERLLVAKEKLGAEVINFALEDPLEAVPKLAPREGPHVCIDAVGFRFPKSTLHKIQRALKLETDAPQVLSECIKTVRKGGTVSVVGDYLSMANAYPVGAFMEKGLTMRAGQVYVQKYWKTLLEYIEQGKVDPTFVITHRMPLEQAPRAYQLFDEKEDGCIKVILKPPLESATMPRAV